MPARKRTTPEPKLPDNVNPTVAEVIGRIESRLDGQEETDNRIESTLTQLMRDHNEERKNSAVQFGELGKKVEKVSAVLEESIKGNQTILENQNHMIERMSAISKDSQKLEIEYGEFRKIVEEHFAFSTKWTASIEERLHKLETTKYLWYTIGGLIMVLLAAASYVATILGTFK